MTIPELLALEGIGLAELDERAALQSRVDRKYIVPVASVGPLIERLAKVSSALEIDGVRQFRYRSLYFDTPELLGYRLTAHRHRRRFKVRTRRYEDSGACFVEVKVPGPRGSTVKHRAEHDSPDSIEGGRSFVDGALLALGLRAELVAVLHTTYRRCTLLLEGHDSRVTIDTGLHWRDGRRELCLPGIAIVETKTGAGAGPADRELWRRGHRPVAVSKYATGLAALRTELPAAPWRRVLKRYFDSGGEQP
jgi:hypothetical protein